MSASHLAVLCAMVIGASQGCLGGACARQGVLLVRERGLGHAVPPFLGGTSLALRGGGKKKRTRDSEEPHDRKRAREEGPSGDPASEGGDTSDESVDTLEYTTAPQGGEFGGELALHPLGTVPPPIEVPPTDAARGGESESKGDESSDSFPGCYEGVSEEEQDESEESDEDTGPLPTREELIQRIRGRPFNASLVRRRPVVDTLHYREMQGR